MASCVLCFVPAGAVGIALVSILPPPRRWPEHVLRVYCGRLQAGTLFRDLPRSVSQRGPGAFASRFAFGRLGGLGNSAVRPRVTLGGVVQRYVRESLRWRLAAVRPRVTLVAC